MQPADTVRSAHSQDSLSALADRIREAHRAARESMANALANALVAGDALIEVRLRSPVGGWQRWSVSNCLLALSTVKLYIQLAEHRAEIQVELANDPDLSIRAARRLIAKKTPRSPKTTPPPFALLSMWKRENTDEQKRLLVFITVAGYLQLISPEMRAELERRVGGLHASGKSGVEHEKLSHMLRQALSLLRAADVPETSAAVAQCSEKAALNALRGILRFWPDLNELSIGIGLTRREKKRRAA
jgi:hypothetical protein